MEPHSRSVDSDLRHSRSNGSADSPYPLEGADVQICEGSKSLWQPRRSPPSVRTWNISSPLPSPLSPSDPWRRRHVWGAPAPGSSSPGMRCSRGRRGPSPDAPTAQQQTMDPASPSTTVNAGFRCQLPIGSRRTAWMRFPGPIVRATQAMTCFGSSSAAVPRYSSRSVALGSR
jgi:hypothetical protein